MHQWVVHILIQLVYFIYLLLVPTTFVIFIVILSIFFWHICILFYGVFIDRLQFLWFEVFISLNQIFNHREISKLCCNMKAWVLLSVLISNLPSELLLIHLLINRLWYFGQVGIGVFTHIVKILVAKFLYLLAWLVGESVFGWKYWLIERRDKRYSLVQGSLLLWDLWHELLHCYAIS